VCCDAHTHELLQCAIPFSVCCLLARFGGGGRGTRVPAAPLPAQPASQQHTPMYSRLFVVVSHIYIYIYMLHITHRQTSIDICLSIFSLSIHSLGSCCLHTLTPPPPPHDSRRACVCVCVCVCIWLPFEQCFRRPDNRPHIMIIIMPRTNNRRTPPLKRTTPRPIRAVLCCVVCVYWCVLLRSCRQRWTGRNTCRPAAARLLPQEQQAGMQETGTHLPTMLLLLLLLL